MSDRQPGDSMPEWTTIGDVARFRAGAVRRVIGRGTFKKVSVIALDDPHGGEFALAEYSPRDYRLDREYRGHARFCQEVRAMHVLRHENVMSVIAADLGADIPWFVMPLAEMNFEGLAGSVRSRAEAAVAVRQVAEGLSELHARGYVHRDLKPNNIFRIAGRWVVADLGLLRDFGRSGMTVEGLNLLGSHRAPEVRDSLRSATQASDVFSLGWLVRNIVPQVERMLSGHSQPFATIETAPRLRAVVDRCLAGRPADRYPNAVVLRGDLVTALDEWAVVPAGS